MRNLFKRSCGIALVLSTVACGSNDDAGSSESPEGTGGSVANTATAGKSSGGSTSSARAGVGGSTTAGTTAARAGNSATTQPAAAGKSGAGGKSAAVADEDAGVPTAGSAAAGSGGTAGRTGAAGSGGAGPKAGSGGSGGAAGSGSATAATFTQVYALLSTGCAGATCHVKATVAGGMLSMADKASAYTNLVNADATQCRGEKRVVPKDPAKSELVASLKHIQVGSCARTPRMPDNMPQWKDSDIALVSSWIEAGAQNN